MVYLLSGALATVILAACIQLLRTMTGDTDRARNLEMRARAEDIARDADTRRNSWRHFYDV